MTSLTNGGSSVGRGNGSVQATILSVYDLPDRDPPLAVSFTVNGQTVRTGPPSQRHKDRNSFKFNQQTLTVHADLADLHSTVAVVKLEYRMHALTAAYALKQLKIHETVWLILQLDDADGDEIPPTLRLRMTLKGPYRPEISSIFGATRAWFGVVDQGEAALTKFVGKIPTFDPKFLLIPATPVVAGVLVSIPIVVGIILLTLPVALPVMVILGAGLGLGLAGLAGLYASTATGRTQLAKATQSMVQFLTSTPVGQTCLYQTGPRPTPVALTKTILPDGMYQRLILSLLVDTIGSCSYLLPLAGEGFDVVWAPIQTVIIMAMYDSRALGYVSAAEELLPFTDVLPTACVGWIMEHGMPLLLKQDKTGGADNLRSMIRKSVSSTVGPPVTPVRNNNKIPMQ